MCHVTKLARNVSEENLWLMVFIIPAVVVAILTVLGVDALHAAWVKDPRWFNYPTEFYFFFDWTWGFFLIIMAFCIYCYGEYEIYPAMSNLPREEKLSLVRKVAQLYIKVAVSVLAIILISAFAIDHIFALQYLPSTYFHVLLVFYAIVAGVMAGTYCHLRNAANGQQG
jgi:magnesium-transporting ATPase (P-type)